MFNKIAPGVALPGKLIPKEMISNKNLSKCKLDAMCIVVLGGDSRIVRTIASLLVDNGAMLFISAGNENALKADLNHIRQQVPGCSINGAHANISFAEDVSLFFLKAEIALPKHDALIYFPDGGISAEKFMLASNRLIRLMVNHQGGEIINIAGIVADGKATGKMINDFSEALHKRLGPLGIKVTKLALDYGTEYGDAFASGEGNNALNDSIAKAVLDVLSNSTAPRNDKLSHHQ